MQLEWIGSEMANTLENTPVLHLLAELLHDGQAGLPELAAYEPINLELLLSALREKTGTDQGQKFQGWFDWFLTESTESTDEERKMLEMMKQMLDRVRHYEEVLAKRNKQHPE
jgi:hypothetical protein